MATHTPSALDVAQRRFTRTLIRRACDRSRLHQLRDSVDRAEIELLTRPAAIPVLRAHLLAPPSEPSAAQIRAARVAPQIACVESWRTISLNAVGVAAARGSLAAIGALHTRAKNCGPLQLAAQEALRALPQLTRIARGRRNLATLHLQLALGEQLLFRLDGVARRNGVDAHFSRIAQAMHFGVSLVMQDIASLLPETIVSAGEESLYVRFRHDVLIHTLDHIVTLAEVVPEKVAQHAWRFHPAYQSELLGWLVHTLQGHIMQADHMHVTLHLPGNNARLPERFPWQEIGVVLRELVHNAIKYRDRTKPNPTVWVECGEAMEFIRVRDNGIGIQRENLARIGDDGFRELRAEGVDGTGLGLEIANARLISIGWRPLEVESIAGDGASFTVRPM